MMRHHAAALKLFALVPAILGVCLWSLSVVEASLSDGEVHSAEQSREINRIRSVLGIELVPIPGGSFEMGSEKGKEDERPVHTVRVSPFYLGRHEVTVAQWKKLMGKSPSPWSGYDENAPVDGVSFHYAQEYVRRAREETGLNLRLPTEAEWEYAAGGGPSHQQWAGTDEEGTIDSVAWYHNTTSPRFPKPLMKISLFAFASGRPQPVGRKKPNRHGLYDMSGNVDELCSDWYDEGYYARSPEQNPQGPLSGNEWVRLYGPYDNPTGVVGLSKRYFSTSGSVRERNPDGTWSKVQQVARGGGYSASARDLRVAARLPLGTFHLGRGVGFRIAWGGDPAEPQPDGEGRRDGEAAVPESPAERITRLTGIEMVHVQAGEAAGKEAAEPADGIAPLRDFFIGRYEVTQAQWKKIMGANPSYNAGCAGCPVETVRALKVREFLREAGALTLTSLRLPTEAEWEFAARGPGKPTKWPGTDDESRLSDFAWLKENAGDRTHPVGGKKPNHLGLYDVSGNVREMVHRSRQKPRGKHVLSGPKFWRGQGVVGTKGGSFFDPPRNLLIAARLPGGGGGTRNVGFRVAWSGIETTIMPAREKPALVSPSPGAQESEAERVARLTGVELVKIPGGVFEMGSDRHLEGPPVQVEVKDFYLGRYEISQEQWKELVGGNPSYFSDCPECPVESVRCEDPRSSELFWDDLNHFLAKIREISGAALRLPTEAEWEYAAGGEPEAGAGDYAWHQDSSGEMTHPVGTKKPNRHGLHDMMGNVSEWCSNWRGDGDFLILKGTNFRTSPQNIRTTLRGRTNRVGRWPYAGFRIALDSE